jgi:hypothetical protein
LVNATIHFPWGESGVTEHLAIQDLPRMMSVCSTDSLEDLIGQVKLSISADEKRFGIPLTLTSSTTPMLGWRLSLVPFGTLHSIIMGWWSLIHVLFYQWLDLMSSISQHT